MSLTVLVTGGSGFIGTYVTERLREKYNVRVLDIREPRNGRLDFNKGSVLNLEDVMRATDDCDVVVHLAGVVGVQRTESHPIDTLNVNILGTRNVMEACRTNHVGKILYSSSSEVYGEPLQSPVAETACPMPVTTYGISKLAGEEYVKSYSNVYGMKYTILRFFNAYGPRQTADFVIPRFLGLAVRGEPILIHGDGSQTRSFCHIKDISYSVSLAIDRADNEVLNIGNNSEPITIRGLAEEVISISNSKSPMTFLPFPNSGRGERYETMKRIPDIAKARRILGYDPKVSLREGLRGMLQGENGPS